MKYKLKSGPKPKSEVGRVRANARRIHNIWVFDLYRDTEQVIYIKDKHNPEEVFRLWLDINSDFLQGVDPKSFPHRLNSPFNEIWKEIKEDYEWSKIEGNSFTFEESKLKCPKCGEHFKKLPFHLPKCNAE